MYSEKVKISVKDGDEKFQKLVRIESDGAWQSVQDVVESIAHDAFNSSVSFSWWYV